MRAKKTTEAAERAKKLQEELIRKKKAAAGGSPDPAPGADPAPAATATPRQPIDPDPGDGGDDFLPPGSPGEGQDDDIAGGQVAGEQILPEPPAVQQPVAASKDWEQMYRVLQGKYNTEIGALNSRVQMLEGLLAQMQPSAPAAPAGGDGLDEKQKQMVSVLRDQYPDIHDAVMAILDSRLRTTGGASPKVESRVAALETHVSKTREDAFYDALDHQIPGWEKVNVHPTFLSWLAEIDDLSGIKKSELLRQAYERLDAKRTINVFTRFRNEKGWVRVEPTTGQRMAGDARAAGSAVDVHPQASGSGGPRNPAPRNQKGKIVTRSEIAKFYDDVRRGRYKAKPKEKAAFEAEIATAAREGRVR